MTILNTAISGLLASQRSLATVSHNISNVNTEGYSRQRVELAAREAQRAGPGYIGSGVEATSIKRISNQFLITQLRSSTTASSEADAFMAMASRLDTMLADAETGLTPSLQNFFSALQDVNDLPSSVTARQVFLSEAQSLTERFQFLDQRMSVLSDELQNKLNDDISDVNNIARSIADINSRIVEATGVAAGQPPNDLLDQRDQLILDLSELVSVTTLEQNDGSMNVFIGQGQPLVIAKNANTLGLSEPYEGRFEVTMTDSFYSAIVTDSITGGSLGAGLNFQTTMLEPARNELGRVALGLAETFNDQHRLGISLDGDVDTPFFSVGTASVNALNGAPATVSATISDISALTDSDYNLVSNGDDTFTLTRLSDNSVTTINSGGTYPYTSASIDGFTLTINGTGTAGDQYVVRPTINGASDISVLINDPRKLALAGPLKAGAATNSAGIATNLGNATISEPTIARTDGIAMSGVPLASSINLTFNAGTNTFDYTVPAPGGSLAYDPATENAGKTFTINLNANESTTFSISGFPQDGDSFVIENNFNADGDNRNGLLLSELQFTRTLINGSASYQDAYGQMVAEIGAKTRQTEISGEALSVLREQALEARESVSGVNLDEEAANMLKFQQSYSAAAQMISVADSLFESLINAFR